MELDDITGAAIEEAIRIHRKPGPGLLESVYVRLLERRLQRRGLSVESQLGIDFTYDGIDFKDGFRIDLLSSPRARAVVRVSARNNKPVRHARL